MYRNFTIYVAKTKALISCLGTMQLICLFILAYGVIYFLFSHDLPQFLFEFCLSHICALRTIISQLHRRGIGSYQKYIPLAGLLKYYKRYVNGIANSEDPDQEQSYQDLHCLSENLGSLC